MSFSDPSKEILQLKLTLHRELFAFIKSSRAEGEVVRFIVDSIWPHFSDCRLAYSELDAEAQWRVLYSKQPDEQPDLTGRVLDLRKAPEFFATIRQGKTFFIGDICRHNALPIEFGERMRRLTGASSILICPVVTESGGVEIFSASHPSPKSWDERAVEFISEFAEVVHPFLAQARAQQALKRSEAIFREFAENSDVVFWMADPENSESIYVSPAYDLIWGTTREELRKDPQAFLNAIIPEDRQMVIRSFLEHRKGPFEKFYRLRHPNGEIRWIKDRSFPVKNENGEIYRVVGFAEDITALREAQDRLEVSKGQAASSAKFAALGEMASGIAHEINNPLTVIQGLAQQLGEAVKKGRVSPLEFQESLETIEKMSVRIASIVKGLRTFSRKTEEDPMVSASLLAILQETVAICEPGLQAMGVKLTTDFPNKDFLLSCRPSEISQVLLNLLNNAKDAACLAEEKFIIVGLKTALGKLLIEVEDSGTGVPEGIREKIFQPFFTTKDVGAGTGLGLSISRGIVEAHGGRLFLDSSSPGAKFVVELPAETK